MINAVEVRRSLESSKLIKIEEIRPDVLKAERVDAHGRTYAVYFFDVADKVEERDGGLEQFQDEVIGPSYFRSSGDLRWNHYLYVLASSQTIAKPEFAVRKRRIEQDRNYARKFVIPETQLRWALENLEAPRTPDLQPQRQDVLLRWTQRLVTSKLEVVLEQKPLAETVRLISEGYVPAIAVAELPKSVSVQDDPMASQFLRGLSIAKFRRLPFPPQFSGFGKVNLIYGPNGVGKTSMLEAIEYLYCGDNARITSPEDANVRGQFGDNDAWIETSPKIKSVELRRRNLAWFGQRDLKGSSVVNGFSRFNFLSTDEAALLAKDPSVDLDEMLARMVVGQQAADLWAHIQKLKQPLDREIVRLSGLVNTGKSEEARLLERVAAAESAPKQSDSEFSSLAEDLRRLNWAESLTKDNIGIGQDLIPRLTTLLSMVRTLLTASPNLGNRAPTLSAVKADVQETARIATGVDVELENLKAGQKQLHNADVALGQQRTAHQRLSRIHWLINAEAFKLVKQFDDGTRRRDYLLRQTASSSSPAELPSALKMLGVSTAEAVEAYGKERQSAANEARRLDDEIRAKARVQNASRQLAEEIRALSRRLLDHEAHLIDCPVCGTSFEQGRLRELVAATVESVGNEGEQLLSARDFQKSREAEAAEMCNLLADLVAYAGRSGLEISKLTPLQIHADLSVSRQQLSQAQALVTAAEDRLKAFSRDGFSVQEIRDAHKFADEIKVSVDNLQEVQGKIFDSEQSLTVLGLKAASVQTEIEEISQRIRVTVLGADASVTVPLEHVLANLQQRVSFASQAKRLVEAIENEISSSDEVELSAFAAILDSAKSTAERYIAIATQERLTGEAGSHAKALLSEIRTKVANDEASLGRLRRTQSILDDIEANDSLVAATDNELNETQSLTAAVWERIHSPHEYGVKRGIQRPLYRLDDTDESPVSLQEISSGQRAAFVLSVFLAMNAKLKSGPPIVLLDDPVAHIDDFNALSFIDYLRELVLSRQRQVFYATADSRLAGLFEHKFGFLGDQFKRFNLQRP
jgi:hypothetical protein